MADDDALARLGELTKEQRKSLQELIDLAASERADKILESKGPAHREKLQRCLDLYLEEASFQVGDLVIWKDGLKNRRLPQYGEPVIVAEVIDPPLLGSEENSGSAYYREPINLKLGLIDDDSELIFFHFDGRRFRKFEADVD